MPVYTVYATADHLSPAIKADVARGITRVHSELTGTPRFLAQVIFQDVSAGNFFLGGNPQRAVNVFVHGQTRSGRTPERKRELTIKLVEAVSKITSIDKRRIWTYIDERPASQMAEYGHILPDPGKEAEWLATLPREDRTFMEANVWSPE